MVHNDTVQLLQNSVSHEEQQQQQKDVETKF